MEIKTENIVAENAILPAEMPIDSKRFEAEKKYRLSAKIIDTILSTGLITKEEYAIIDTNLRQKFKPIL